MKQQLNFKQVKKCKNCKESNCEYKLTYGKSIYKIRDCDVKTYETLPLEIKEKLF